MIEGIRNSLLKSKIMGTISLCACLVVLQACKGVTEVDSTDSVGRETVRFSGTNQALVYEFNPVVLSNQKTFNKPNYDRVLTAETITSGSTLEYACNFKQFLTTSFSQTSTNDNNCMSVLNDRSASTQAIGRVNNSWNFETYSDDFYQVNTFYHVKKIIDRYLDSLSFVQKTVHIDDDDIQIPPATKANMADTLTYWLIDKTNVSSDIFDIKVYSKCDLPDINASFEASKNTICLGHVKTDPDFYMTQDPSVTYHEVGHLLVKILMNQRNKNVQMNFVGLTDLSDYLVSNLGYTSYDEAGGINEGIADFFSYYMNARQKVGEWGIAKVAGTHRPLQENDSAHTADVSKAEGERLSYPQFIYHQFNNPSVVDEQTHNTGLIVAHYLVALTEELKTTAQNDSSNCSIRTSSTSALHADASNYVFLALSETLAELGDTSAKGSDFFNEFYNFFSDANQKGVYFTNLNEDESFFWTTIVNPINMRRFSRVFAKNVHHHITKNLCTGFSQDESETLLDEYGLLLFRSYEDVGNGFDTTNLVEVKYEDYNGYGVFSEPLAAIDSVIDGNTQVNEANRRNTVLISKDFIELDDEFQAIFFDSPSGISSILSRLVFEGNQVTTSTDIAGTEYNNGNARVSPGEVVGIAINLANESNSTMAGIQILANDWDHMKLDVPSDDIYTDADATNDLPYNYVNRTINETGLDAGTIDGYTAFLSPCQYDGFPTLTEGAVTDTDSTIAGNCASNSKTNAVVEVTTVGGESFPVYEDDAPQPICLVQYRDENETKWVSQDFFRKYGMDELEDSQCLNGPSMSSLNYNPNECLVRSLPGANQAIYGKISAQSTWPDTMTEDLAVNPNFVYTESNIMLFEINKRIPPGTKFLCRFRVRFSNCSDCFDEISGTRWSDFADHEYTGDKPFKVINLSFEVID